MDSISVEEISVIEKLQRESGLQMLSSHFSWPEFCDEQQGFHQEFVYDTVMFAVDRGFSWPNVILAAVIAKGLFPQLSVQETPKLLSALKDSLSAILPSLPPTKRFEFTEYLTEICTTRQRLFRAVVEGAANLTVNQLHVEVEFPPRVCPLTQGTMLSLLEHQRHVDLLNFYLGQKEKQLKTLRHSSRVVLGELHVPEDGRLNNEDVLQLVRAAMSSTQGQVEASLNQEATLLSEILQLKVELAKATCRRIGDPPREVSNDSHQETHKHKESHAHKSKTK